MELTKIQSELMDHALSGPNWHCFLTDKKCSDGIEFEKLAKAGYAESRNAPSWVCGDTFYWVTKKGKEVLNLYQRINKNKLLQKGS